MNPPTPSTDESSAIPLDLPATERRHEGSFDLDEMPVLELLELLNSEDRRAVTAVSAVLPAVARLVEVATERLQRGGSVHYFGAGTSGRLAVLDAAELVPTFNLDDRIVQAHIAGGSDALVHSVELAEDSEASGASEAASLGTMDIAIGLAASGTTPYVAGVLRAARSRGAYTALVTSNQASPLAALADIVIAPDTGAEVLTGSTRLKAGTAEKVILNGFSTALMVAMGRTYSNLMVSMLATNAKLRERALRILGEISGAASEQNASLLSAADGDLKLAIVTLLSSASLDRSREALERSAGSVRGALHVLGSDPLVAEGDEGSQR